MAAMPIFEIGYDVVDAPGPHAGSTAAAHYYVNGIEVPKDEYYARWLATQHDLHQSGLTSRKPASSHRV